MIESVSVAARAVPVPPSAEDEAVGQVEPQVLRLVASLALALPVGQRHLLVDVELQQAVSMLADLEVLIGDPRRQILCLGG
jgi:hypothetical protein